MKTECPHCAMSVDENTEKCAFCGAALVECQQPRAENRWSTWALGCLAPLMSLLLMLEMFLIRSALSRDADANFARFWALVFGVLTFAALRQFWKNIR